MGVEDDRFPVGLRVLVVDDDPTCLRLMHTLLLKCDYHVTTTNQAMEALKMLRQNDNKFDIVISDVHMPDMDGFRLLELVGIEMDLPVIMLSAYGDAQLVMKGIRHGACDYLLKPVRIQELKNIWQHVVRRIKCTHQGKESCRAGDGEKGSAHDSGEEQEQDEELRRKRTDQNSDEDDEEIEGKGCENDEDTSSRKKPRVAWSAELHRKFVAAVDQLGLDRAFPKKILDLMNVEGLTRENVASHLQKYRQGLKRINSQATQLENSAAALGGKDSYMYMGSLQGQDGVIRSLVGPGRFLRSNASLSYQPGRMLGQLNTASGLSLRALSSSSLLQGCQAQNSNNSFKALAKIRPLGLPSNQNASLFQGIPTTLELDHLQMQQNKYSLLGPSGTYLASIGNLQKMGMKFGTLGDQTVLNVVSSDADPLREPIGTCSSLVDYNKCEKYWGRDVQPVVAPNHFDESNDGTDPLDLFCGISSLEASTGTNQRCQDPEQDNILNSNNMFSTPSSLGPVVPRLNDLDQSNGISGVPSLRLLENATSTLIRQGEVQKPNNNQKVRIDDDYVLEDTGFLNSFAHNSCESLEDMVAGFIKQGNGDSTSLCDELGLDVFPI